MSIYKNDKLIYVAQCVDSLLKQTFKDFHVYVQYDGVVESGIEHFFMELNDSRFHVYGRDENYGLAYSLNELLTIYYLKGMITFSVWMLMIFVFQIDLKNK